MIDNYEFQLLSVDLSQTESILQVLSNLEKLEVIRDKIFNKINAGISSRVLKLENLRSRIIRANQAIASYNRTQALTIKSKRFYPEASFTYSNPINFNANANANIKEPEALINTNPKIGEFAGSMPISTSDGTQVIQSLLNDIPTFADISEKLANDNKKYGLQEPSDLDPVKNFMTSYFNAFEKNMISQKRNALKFKDQSFYHGLDSIIISDPKKKKPKAKPQEAPISIIQKDKFKSYVKKKNVNLQNPNNNFDINLPQNINLLGNIADFDLNSSIAPDEVIESNANITDLLEEDENFNSSECDFWEDLPFELIQSKKADAYKKNTPNPNSNVQSNPTYTNYTSVNQSSSTPSIPTVPSGTSNQTPIAPSNANQPQIICNTSSAVPIPPPLPFFPAIAKPPVTTKKVKEQEKANTKPDPNKTNPPEIKEEEDKTNQDEDKKEEDIERLKEKPQEEERGKTMQELIGDNPMSRLKKVPTKEEIAKIEEEGEVHPKKPKSQQGLMDALKNQIQLRYKNLRKHQETSSENESDSD